MTRKLESKLYEMVHPTRFTVFDFNKSYEWLVGWLVVPRLLSNSTHVIYIHIYLVVLANQRKVNLCSLNGPTTILKKS